MPDYKTKHQGWYIEQVQGIGIANSRGMRIEVSSPSRDYLVIPDPDPELKELLEKLDELFRDVPRLPPQFWEPLFVMQPTQEQPCMFDNLPPGVYGLACPCPRCSPRTTSP